MGDLAQMTSMMADSVSFGVSYRLLQCCCPSCVSLSDRWQCTATPGLQCLPPRGMNLTSWWQAPPLSKTGGAFASVSPSGQQRALPVPHWYHYGTPAGIPYSVPTAPHAHTQQLLLRPHPSSCSSTHSPWPLPASPHPGHHMGSWDPPPHTRQKAAYVQLILLGVESGRVYARPWTGK